MLPESSLWNFQQFFVTSEPFLGRLPVDVDVAVVAFTSVLKSHFRIIKETMKEEGRKSAYKITLRRVRIFFIVMCSLNSCCPNFSGPYAYKMSYCIMCSVFKINTCKTKGEWQRHINPLKLSC